MGSFTLIYLLWRKTFFFLCGMSFFRNHIYFRIFRCLHCKKFLDHFRGQSLFSAIFSLISGICFSVEIIGIIFFDFLIIKEIQGHFLTLRRSSRQSTIKFLPSGISILARLLFTKHRTLLKKRYHPHKYIKFKRKFVCLTKCAEGESLTQTTQTLR